MDKVMQFVSEIGVGERGSGDVTNTVVVTQSNGDIGTMWHRNTIVGGF